MHWATAPAARAQPAAGGIGLNGLRVTVSVVFENENDVTVKKKPSFLNRSLPKFHFWDEESS